MNWGVCPRRRKHMGGATVFARGEFGDSGVKAKRAKEKAVAEGGAEAR